MTTMNKFEYNKYLVLNSKDNVNAIKKQYNELLHMYDKERKNAQNMFAEFERYVWKRDGELLCFGFRKKYDQEYHLDNDKEDECECRCVDHIKEKEEEDKIDSSLGYQINK